MSLHKNNNEFQDQLSNLRDSIDEIDNEICTLFVKRSEVIQAIMKIKASFKLSPLDPKREAVLLKERLRLCPKLWPAKGYRHLWREVISCGLLQQDNNWLLKLDSEVPCNMFSEVRSYVGMGMKLASFNSEKNKTNSWHDVEITNKTILAILGTTLYRLGIPPSDLQVFKAFIIASSDKDNKPAKKLIIEDGEKNMIVKAENICFIMSNRTILNNNNPWNYKVFLDGYAKNILNEKFESLKISNNNSTSSSFIDIGGVDSIY